MREHEGVDSQGGSLNEGREEQGGGGPHAHARQLPGGRVHGAVGQRPAGLTLGLTEHLRPESLSLRCPLRNFRMVSARCGGTVMVLLFHGFIVMVSASVSSVLRPLRGATVAQEDCR